MQPYEQYDYLTKVRGTLFEWIRQLNADQYGRQFPYGLKTIHATLTHTAGSEWTNARRLQGSSPTAADSPFAGDRTKTFADVAAAWTAQAPQTRAALAAVSNWTDPVEFRLTIPNQPVVRVRTTAGGIASQLLFHEIHHRAQIMSMLRQHGIAAQNLDFSATMYHRTPE